jgi:phage tail sheath protein FI
MPITPTYPGVYIEEIPSGVRTITGVATSITAFIGSAMRGPVNDPVTINSYGDFEKIFGGLWVYSTLGYAVRDFFLNSGGQAIVVRLYHETAGGAPPKAPLTIDDLTLEAANEGAWGKYLRGTIDTDVAPDVRTRLNLGANDLLFNLTVTDASPGGSTEVHRNLTFVNSSRRIDKVLAAESNLVRYTYPANPANLPTLPSVAPYEQARQDLDAALSANPQVPADITAAEAALRTASEDLVDSVTQAEMKLADAQKQLSDAQKASPQVPADITAAQNAVNTRTTNLTNAQTARDAAVEAGTEPLTIADFSPANGQTNKEGLYALEDADLFNLLCIPPYMNDNLDVDTNLISEAAAYCEKRRAMLLVDPPSAWTDKSKAKTGITAGVGTTSKNAALFFPRLYQQNPLQNNQFEEFAPCGTVAGVFARTDTQRGVWKAPAGLDAVLNNVPALSVNLTDAENGELNPLGVNCLRTLVPAGRVVWGARTMQGDDRFGSEWKYIPVRRTALFIEESLYRGTQWVVFEPNDEPLWGQIRLNIGAFMHNLFRQGAFQGTTPKDAYFVKCDKETTTQNDINLGIVNIIVGFAPLKPAEFVIVKLQQMAGQIVT